MLYRRIILARQIEIDFFASSTADMSAHPLADLLSDPVVSSDHLDDQKSDKNEVKRDLPLAGQIKGNLSAYKIAK